MTQPNVYLPISMDDGENGPVSERYKAVAAVKALHLRGELFPMGTPIVVSEKDLNNEASAIIAGRIAVPPRFGCPCQVGVRRNDLHLLAEPCIFKKAEVRPLNDENLAGVEQSIKSGRNSILTFLLGHEELPLLVDILSFYVKSHEHAAITGFNQLFPKGRQLNAYLNFVNLDYCVPKIEDDVIDGIGIDIGFYNAEQQQVSDRRRIRVGSISVILSNQLKNVLFVDGNDITSGKEEISENIDAFARGIGAVIEICRNPGARRAIIPCPEGGCKLRSNELEDEEELSEESMEDPMEEPMEDSVYGIGEDIEPYDIPLSVPRFAALDGTVTAKDPGRVVEVKCTPEFKPGSHAFYDAIANSPPIKGRSKKALYESYFETPGELKTKAPRGSREPYKRTWGDGTQKTGNVKEIKTGWSGADFEKALNNFGTGTFYSGPSSKQEHLEAYEEDARPKDPEPGQQEE